MIILRLVKISSHSLYVNYPLFNCYFFYFVFILFYLHLEKVTQFYVELISCDHL